MGFTPLNPALFLSYSIVEKMKTNKIKEDELDILNWLFNIFIGVGLITGVVFLSYMFLESF